MAKFVWQDGTLVSKAKVEINGTIYEVDPEEYSGTTPLSASNLNAMVDSIYDDLDANVYSTNETVIGMWNGKPLYRKLFNIDSDLPNGTVANQQMQLSSIPSSFVQTIENITDATVCRFGASPLVLNSWGYLQKVDSGNYIQLFPTSSVSKSGTQYFYLTIEYTKNTD